MDITTDVLNILDTACISPRVKYLDDSGIYESHPKLTATNYVRKGTFWSDFVSMVPIDYACYALADYPQAWQALLRVPRLLRYAKITEFFDRLDSLLPYPVVVRLARTVNIMLYLIHLSGCAYYSFSWYTGIGSTSRFETIIC